MVSSFRIASLFLSSARLPPPSAVTHPPSSSLRPRATCLLQTPKPTRPIQSVSLTYLNSPANRTSDSARYTAHCALDAFELVPVNPESLA